MQPEAAVDDDIADEEVDEDLIHNSTDGAESEASVASDGGDGSAGAADPAGRGGAKGGRGRGCGRGRGRGRGRGGKAAGSAAGSGTGDAEAAAEKPSKYPWVDAGRGRRVVRQGQLWTRIASRFGGLERFEQRSRHLQDLLHGLLRPVGLVAR